MSSRIRWLHDELEQWLRDGVIEPSQAVAIRGRYPAPGPNRPWAMIIFAGLGAVIIGFGIILLFAYNWAAMPKILKLALVFGALAAAHGTGIYLHQRSARFRTIGEALTVLGTMMFGAGIWLVAQIYHIDEHFPNAFLLWGLGALLMAWAVPSVFQGVLATILLTIWAGCEAGGFDRPLHLALPLMLGGLLPLAYRERSRVLLAFVVPAAGVMLSCVTVAVTHGNEELIFLQVFALAAAVVAVGLLHRSSRRFASFAPVYTFLGMLVYLFLLFLLTFPDVGEEILDVRLRAAMAGWIYWSVVTVAALVLWIVTAIRRAVATDAAATAIPLDYFLVPLALLLVQAFNWIFPGLDDWWVGFPFNVVFLAHAVGLMARGVQRTRLAPTVLGAVLLVFLGGARYADLFDSLLTRGLVFVVVGGALFAEGICYARGRRESPDGQLEENHA